MEASFVADTRDNTPSAGNPADNLEQEVRSLVDEYRHGPDDIELDTEKLATLLQQLPESRCPYERGLLAMETDNDEEAIRYFQQAFQADNRCVEAAQELGKLYTGKEDWKQARTYYDQALRSADKADKPFLWAEQGHYYFLSDQISKATECYGKALKADEHFPLALDGLGQIHFEQKD